MERNDTQILFPYDPQKFWTEMRKLIQEELEGKMAASEKNEADESILERVEVAKMLRVSLVTLNDWVKRGLPSHKQRGKVYFLYSEVMEYLKNKKRPLP